MEMKVELLSNEDHSIDFVEGVTVRKIMETVNVVNALLLTTSEFVRYAKSAGKSEKAGAMLRIANIADPERPRSLLLRPFGFVPADGRDAYAETTARKVWQLINHPDHISSYQSRDGITFWGGAYLIPDLDAALSISGHPELADEAIGLGTGLELRWINLNYATQIAKINDNFLFKALCPRLPRFQIPDKEKMG